MLYLVDVEGHSFGDAARWLGCTLAAARKRASRARKALGHEIEEVR